MFFWLSVVDMGPKSLPDRYELICFNDVVGNVFSADRNLTNNQTKVHFFSGFI